MTHRHQRGWLKKDPPRSDLFRWSTLGDNSRHRSYKASRKVDRSGALLAWAVPAALRIDE